MFDIRRERVYRCSPEVLWRALATRRGLEAWLMPCDFEPVVGHEFTFRTDPVPGFDGTVHATVLELDAPHQLRLAWRAGKLDTEVSFLIEKIDANHTRLRLEHTGFGGLGGLVPRVALGLGWRKLLRVRLAAWIDEELEVREVRA